MAGFLFFPRADKAQDDIWDYTVDNWGQAQAEKFIRGLHNHLQMLSDKLKPWCELPNSLIVPPNLDSAAYFSKYEHHYIFFRTLSKGRIGIMSILHEKSDIPVRLSADLESFSKQER